MKEVNVTGHIHFGFPNPRPTFSCESGSYWLQHLPFILDFSLHSRKVYMADSTEVKVPID